MAGNIDIVITKSISRFARNTLDCLKYIRQLKEKNIAVWFEKENINTMDAKGEVLITIMASLAQQESQSLSQNVKLGIQYRYQQGKVQVNLNRFLGYTKDENGNLVIDPKQAEVVRRIYREYLEGYSMKSIALHLEQDGILTGAGNTKWYDSTINKILRNEKYMGDALLQKTVTTDFLTKKRVKNTGVLPQYYVEDDMKRLFLKNFSCRSRKSSSEGGTSTAPLPVKSGPTPATTAFPRLSSAENVAIFTEESTGTSMEGHPSFGAASAVWIHLPQSKSAQTAPSRKIG